MKVRTYTTTNLLPSKQKRHNKNKIKSRIALAVVLLVFISVICGLVYHRYFRGRNHRKLETLSSSAEYELRVTIIDVGQGSSALIESGGEAMLIDSGTRDNSKKIAELLKKRGIESLKYLAATHPHADHIGGMGDLIYAFLPKVLLTDGLKSDNASYKAMMDAADKNNCDISVCEAGETFTLGSAKLTVLSPGKEYESVNDMSLVFQLECGNSTFLFMGDAGKEVEETLLSGKDKSLLDCDILVAGHHGSSDASSESFVRSVSPVEAVISCGKDNDYGHPHRETLELFEKLGVAVRRTDLEGNITYAVNSDSLYRLSEGTAQ